VKVSSFFFVVARRKENQRMPRRNKEETTGRPMTTDGDERRDDKRDEDEGEKDKDEDPQTVSKTTKKRKRIKEDKDNSNNHHHQGMKRKKRETEEREEKEQEKEKTEEGDDTDNKTEAGIEGGEYKDGDDREEEEVLTEQREDGVTMIHDVSWRDTTENHEQRSEGDDDENQPTTPERAARDYQNYRNNLIPPSIKQQRRDAIRKHKQAAQYPANYRGQQLFPPDFDQHAPLQPNTQTRKYRQLTAQTSEIRKDIPEESP